MGKFEILEYKVVETTTPDGDNNFLVENNKVSADTINYAPVVAFSKNPDKLDNK